MTPSLRSAVRQAIGPMTSDSKCDEVVRAVLGVSQEPAHAVSGVLERVARAICREGFDGYDPDELLFDHAPSWVEGTLPPEPSDECEYEIDGECVVQWRRWRSFIPQARAAMGAGDSLIGWQPIETFDYEAEKKRQLSFVVSAWVSDGVRVDLAEFYGGDDEPSGWHDAVLGDYGGQYRLAYQPTMWMPKPDPPSSASPNAGDSSRRDTSKDSVDLEARRAEALMSDGIHAVNSPGSVERIMRLYGDTQPPTRDEEP